MYYVYILQFENNSLYIGSTGDLRRRVKQHQRTKPSFELAYYEAYRAEADAREREHQLKHFGRAYAFLKKRLHYSLAPQNSTQRVVKKVAAVIAITVAGLFLVPSISHAANRYWVGSAGGNTNDTANWASADPASCTGGGASAPGTADIAIFDADCDNGATINANLSVLGLTISTGYIGTVTQAAGITLTVGTSDYSQSDGTFTGNSATIDMNDAYSLTGGTFTSTSGTMSVAGAFTISGTPTFTHNSGTVQFDTSAVTLTPSTATFNNVSFTSAVTKTIADSQTMTVAGTLTLIDGSINQTTIPAAGSVSVTGASITQASTFDGGTGRIEITGTANQTFTGSATTTAGDIPDIEIDKSAGTLTLSGTIRTTNDWTWTAGTVDATTNDSTVVFGGASLTITGSHTLNKVTIDTNNSADSNNIITIASGTTLTVNSTLTIDNTSTGITRLNTGTIDAKGNIALDNLVTNSGGTPATLRITGTVNQTITATGFTQTSGTLPQIVINKASGTLIFPATLRTSNNWTYTAGTLDTTTNNSTVVFAPSGGFTVSGSHTLNNVTVDSNTSNSPGSGMAIASGTTLTVNGTLTMDNTSTGDMRIDTGTLEAKGNIVADDNIINSGGVPATLLISGTGAQTFTGSMSATSGNLPIVNINKSSGTLTLSGTIRTGSDWTWTAGTVDATTNDSTVVFGSASLTITGSHTLDNVTFNGGGFTYTFAATSTTLTVAGTLTLTDGSINQTTIPAAGSIAFTGASITQASTFDGGTGRIEITSTANQTFTGSATTTAGTLPDIEIDKSAGTLTLSGTFRTANDWTWTAGTLDATTNDSTVVFGANANMTLAGSHTLDNVTVNKTTAGNTLTIADSNTLTVVGTLTLTDGNISQTTIPATGSVAAQGNITQASTFDGGTGRIEITGTANQTFTGSATTTSGDLPDIEIDKSAGTLTLSGTFRTANDWTYTAGTLDATTNDTTVVFGSTIPIPVITGSHTLDNITFDANSGATRVWTITSGTTLTAAGNLIIDNSSTGGGTISTGTLAVQGNVTIAATGGSTAYGGTATLTFSGSATQTFTLTGAEALLDIDVKVNKSGGQVNLASTFTANAANQDLIIEEGTFDLNGNALTVNGTSGQLDVESGGNLQLQGGETITANASNPDLQVGSTVTYDGTAGPYTVKDYAYQHLTFNGSGGVFNLGAAESIAGNLTITAGTFDIEGQNVTVTGTFSNSDKLRLQGGETTVSLTNDTDSGTIEYDGTTAFTGLKAGNSYYNLTFNGSGGTWTLGAAADVNGTLTLSAGQLDVSSSNYAITAASWTDSASGDQFNPRSGAVTFDTTGTVNANEAFQNVTINGTGITTSLGAAIDIDGTLILTAGTLDVTGSNFAINVAGNWTNNGGTFSARSGTVTLDSTGQTIGGTTNTTFYNLTKSVTAADTLTITAGRTVTISNNTTLQGASGQRLSLRSSVSGTQWNINPSTTGTRTIQWVDVKDSNNTHATIITCSTGCANSGNNTNWIFPWSGTVYTNEGTTNIGSGKTVAISVNGAAATTGTTDSSGFYSIQLPSDPASGAIVTIYLDGATEKAVVAIVTDGSTFGGHDLYQNRLIIKHDTGTGVTNANLATADNNGDTDITTFYSLDGSNNLTANAGYELFVWTGDTFAPGAAVTADDLDINGTFTMGANAVTATGTWDATGGTFTATTGQTVTLSGTSTETITSNSNSFKNLTLSGNGGHYNSQDAIDVDQTLTISSGATLDVNGSNLTNTGGTFSNDGTLRAQGSETFTGFTNDTNSGTTLFDGTGTYSSLAGLTTFYNLTFNGTGATWTQAANIDANGLVTLTAGTLDSSASNYGVTVAGGWTDSGAGAYTERSGTVTFDGTGTINANEAFNSVTVNGTGITVSLGAALDVNGNLTITAGTLDVTTNNYAITDAGNWSNSGTFTGRSGTVTLDGTNQTIAGSTTFYNVTKSVTAAATLTFTAGTTQTVTNVWTATGASGQLLSLRSSVAGTQWSVNPQSTRTLSFVDVKDSNNTNATTILCTNDCTNSANNTNWAFPIAITVYTDEGVTGMGANKTVAVSVNGGSKTTADTSSSSIASFTTVGLNSGDVVAFWLDDETENGLTVSISNGTTLAFAIYQNRLILQHETGSQITNTNLGVADDSADNDITAIYTVASGALTAATGIEVWVNTSDVFKPGGAVTADDLDINGTFTMETNAVTISGSWDATGGAFSGTGSQTVTFSATAAETVKSNGNCFQNVTYSLGTSGSLTNTDTLCINGTQTVQAAGSGSSGSDTTAPTISDIAVSAGEIKATVSWKTNESADSKVEYGTSAGLGSEKSDTSQTVWHAIQLTGLTANTTYHYKVTSKDASNNSASSEVNTFTTLQAGSTADTTAPTISNISVADVTSAGAKISWSTSENAIGYVNYGETTSYDRGATPGNNTAGTNKTVTLTGLAPSTTYNYQITAVDAAGNVGTSSNQTLATASEAEVPKASEVLQETEFSSSEDAPNLSSEAPAVVDITGSSATIQWTTDKKSTSVVYYRELGSTANPAQVGTTTQITDHSVKLVGLLDATEYEFSVESTDAEGNKVRSKTYQFTTTLPSISDVSVQEITDNCATFVYLSENPTASNIEVTNLANGETLTIEKDDIALQHKIPLCELQPDTEYQVVVVVKGPSGATTRSVAYIFSTQPDTANPILSQIETRSALVEGGEDTVQTIVTWKTNEPANSQLEYNEGLTRGSEFKVKTEPNQDYVVEHVVVLATLQPSTVYEYRVKSTDRAGHEVASEPRVLLTPARRVSALDLIISNLEDTFGWVNQLKFN